MTAKQKAARANFKAVQVEAKKLRAKNKKLSQAQAVKQAWAIMRSQGKVGATLLIEKGESKRTKPKNVIQITRTKGGQFKKVRAVGAAPGKHKDIRSHNVNIRVVSGIDIYSVRDELEKQINNSLQAIDHWKGKLHDPNRPQNKAERIFIKRIIAEVRRRLAFFKKQLREQNKLINSLLK